MLSKKQRAIATLARMQIHTASERTYENAILILNSRRRNGRPLTQMRGDEDIRRMPNSGGRPDLRGKPSIWGMAEWLQLLGHSSADIDRLSIVHVAGTKGKGSTCAFVESFLRVHGRRTGFPSKTGLYTSPHLKVPEERIRINFEPLRRDLFAKYFFEVYDTLHDKCPPEEFQARPRYLQMYALIAFHTFIREGVDAAIFETHHGGEYDATNVVQKPAVTVVTTLGMDHVSQLGPTIENIAWHKAGIFKPGAQAFSSPQATGPRNVLLQRADEKDVTLQTVEIDKSIPASSVQLQPEVQRINCSTALAAANGFLQMKSPFKDGFLSKADISGAIDQFYWPGRFEYMDQGEHKWFMDSAHNDMSMTKAAQWFAETSSRVQSPSQPVTRVLIFSQESDQRDGGEVLQSLATSLPKHGIQFQHVIFTTYVQTPQSTKDSQVLKYIPESGVKPVPPEHYPQLWRDIESTAQIHTVAYIDEALRLARSLRGADGELHSLVTGSQHLVGGVLLLLEAGI